MSITFWGPGQSAVQPDELALAIAAARPPEADDTDVTQGAASTAKLWSAQQVHAAAAAALEGDVTASLETARLQEQLLAPLAQAQIQRLFGEADFGVFFDLRTTEQLAGSIDGTVAATVDSGVGTHLDLSRALVREANLVVDAGSLTYSATGASLVDGALLLERNAGSTVLGLAYLPVQRYGVYEVSFTLEAHPTAGTPIGAVVRDGASGLSSAFGAAGAKTVRRLFIAAEQYILFGNNGARTSARLAGLSVRRVRGVHAFQGTPEERCTLRELPDGRYWLQAAAGQSLNITLAAAPGVVHVGRASDAGMTWGWEDWSTVTRTVVVEGACNRGVVARNREWAASERALIAAYYALPKSTLGLRPYGVGYQEVVRTVGANTVDVAVWYPTDAEMAPVAYGSPPVAGNAAINGPVKTGPWPLVVFSHGFSGSGIGSAFICEMLAASGYVVVAPDHSDAYTTARINSVPNGTLEDALDYLGGDPPSLVTHAYRLAEIDDMIDHFQGAGAATFSVHPTSLALIGHSMGGWTVVNVALTDPRVKALVSYSTGELHWLFTEQRFFTPTELEALTIPVLYTFGSVEKALLAGASVVTADYLYQNTDSPTCLSEIASGRHAVYVNQEAGGEGGGTPGQLYYIGLVTTAFLDRAILAHPVALNATYCKNWPPVFEGV